MMRACLMEFLPSLQTLEIVRLNVRRFALPTWMTWCPQKWLAGLRQMRKGGVYPLQTGVHRAAGDSRPVLRQERAAQFDKERTVVDSRPRREVVAAVSPQERANTFGWKPGRVRQRSCRV